MAQVVTSTITYGPFTQQTSDPVTSISLTYTPGASGVLTVAHANPGDPPLAVVILPGDYTLTTQALDAAGAPVGPPSVETGIVVATTSNFTVQIPVSSLTAVTTTP